MKPDDHLDPLPKELEEALTGIGRAEAPLELRARVELELFGKAQAPTELQARVFTALRPARQAPLLRLRRLVPVAAAAALLISLGVFGPGDSGAAQHPSQQELDAYAALRAEVKQSGSVVRVPIEELSPVARSLAESFGAMRNTEGAE